METQTTVRPKIRVRWDQFEALCNARGWVNENQRAQHIGVRHTTIRRLRPDEHGNVGGNPGGRFISAVLAALGVPFEAVFERTWAN